MDYAIKVHDTRICELDSKKAENSQLLSLVSNWELDETTGIITITKYDGSKILFDLNIEKIPVAFELSSDGILTMTTDDGTAFEANIGDMIPVLQFEDSDTISVSVSGEGINKTYIFSVKKGSITDEMIESQYLASVTVQAASAKQYAENAYQSQNNAAYDAELAQSYAVGSGGTVRENDDTDNAKYYKEQSKLNANAASDSATAAENSALEAAADVLTSTTNVDIATTKAEVATTSAEKAEQYALDAGNYKDVAETSAETATNAADNSEKYSKSANEQALLAQSYASGGTGVRENEDTDNSKYYYNQCKAIAGGDFIPQSDKGVAGGVATLDEYGYVPAVQLPGYVDDVIEGQYINSTEFIDTNGNIITPEGGKVYVDVSTGNVTSGKTYRWSGSLYVVIGSDLALGTTSSTAFRGDLGQTAYEHSQTTGNPHGMSAADIGLGNVPDVSTNDQTPTYTAAEALTELSSGEKISTAFGKIACAIKSFISHIADKVSHITADERTAWNAKADGSHTHMYAGSSSAGGAATTALACSGNATTATALQTARTIRTNLASTSAVSFDGTGNVAPGVTGTLPIANGGTGATTAANAVKALMTSHFTSPAYVLSMGSNGYTGGGGYSTIAELKSVLGIAVSSTNLTITFGSNTGSIILYKVGTVVTARIAIIVSGHVVGANTITGTIPSDFLPSKNMCFSIAGCATSKYVGAFRLTIGTTGSITFVAETTTQAEMYETISWYTT